MSETSATSTTSFINAPTECVPKPPLSSDSSIDSGFSAMTTSDSITSNRSPSSASKPLCNQRRQENPRLTLSMLPPQPLVPPPPPPSQLHDNMNETANRFDKQASFIPSQPSSQPSITNGMNTLSLYTENYFATYAQSSQSNIDHSKSLATSQAQQSSPNQNRPLHQSLNTQRLSTSSLESASSTPLMPMNVKGMLLHGLPSDEVLRNWLSSLKCDDQVENFMYHGYDMHLVTRMTPQDLSAIGCKTPALRKKLLAEIKKLNLEYEVPDCGPSTNLDEWLKSLKMSEYHAILMREGYETVEKACNLTWEDLEEIGIVKLGHQKKLLLAIEKIQKAAKLLEESQNDTAIYDVHPNHRMSLNGCATVGRARSGFFQTRSGAYLDHRGLPVATVIPALKHLNTSGIQGETNQQSPSSDEGAKSTSIYATNDNGQIYDSQARMDAMKLNDLTIRRNPPPLPPVRTNSLKIIPNNGNIVQPIYGNNYTVHEPTIYGKHPTNSTSFLRTPKLGTLTATTNKMLASGGHIQTLSTNTSRIMPIREAPLPPVQQVQMPYQPNIIQTVIPENVDEEPCVDSSSGNDSFPPPPPNCDGLNSSFMSGNQLAGDTDFPPPPPCGPQQ